MKSSKEVTIYDVARELDLSPSTVSRGLKGHPHIRKETKRRIIAAAKEMGYRHNKYASNLRQRQTHTIGVVLPKLNSYFMATAIAGIEKVTNSHGYNLIITQSQESGKKEIAGVSTLFNNRVDGLIVSLAFDTKKSDHFKAFFEKNIPVVFFDRVFECYQCACVTIDNYAAGYQIVSHLIEQGCRRIFHLGGNQLRNVYYDRLNGYKQALKDHGIEFDQDLVMISDLTEKSFNDAVRKISGMKNPPDGVFTVNDSSAVEIIVGLKKAGFKVPQDVAVAGFNNEPVSRVVEPNLTTIDYPAYEMGEFAAITLINRLSNQNAVNVSKIVVEHKLIIRESTLRNL